MKKIFAISLLITLCTFCTTIIQAQSRVGRVECRPEPYTLSGTNMVCGSGSTYTISNPNNYQVMWEASGNLTPNSGSGNSFTVSAIGDGNGYISVSLFFPNSGTCTGWQPVADKIVTTVSSSTASASFSVLGNNTSNFSDYEIYTISPQNDLNYSWTVPQGWQIVSGQGTNTVEVIVGLRSGQVRATRTVCGITKTASKSVSVNSGGGQPLRVFPNSSDGLFNIAIDGAKDFLDLTNATVEVLNTYGISVYNASYNADNTTLDLRNLGAGIYTLRFASKDFVWVTKVIIQK